LRDLRAARVAALSASDLRGGEEVVWGGEEEGRGGEEEV
jgi:hypothetical protein